MKINRTILKHSCYVLLSIVLAAGLLLFVSGCCAGLSSLMSSTSQTGSAAGQTAQETKPDDTVAEESGEQGTATGSEDTSGQDLPEGMAGGIVAEFDDMSSSGDDPVDLLGYIDENIGKVDAEAATYMVGEAIRLSEEKKFEFTDKFTEDNIQEKIYQALDESYEVDMDKLINAQDAGLRALIEETVAKKYKVLSTEGFFMPLVDYAAYDVYYDYINDELKDFISIYLDESNQPSILDAGIVVSADEFLRRMDKAFNYLEKYPDSPRYEKVKQFNGGRLNVYLGGIDNNPVFDSSNKIYPEKLSEIETFAQQYDGSKLGEVLNAYLELLDQEDYIRTSDIDDFLQALYTD